MNKQYNAPDNRKAEFDEVEMEEFRYTAERKMFFEKRIENVYIFSFTGFGAVLAFFGKVYVDVIPILLSLITLLATLKVLIFTKALNFVEAFQFVVFYKNSKSISFERQFDNIEKRSLKYQTGSEQESFWKNTFEIIQNLGPLLLLFLLNISITALFLFYHLLLNQDIIASNSDDINKHHCHSIWVKLIVFSLLVAIHAICITKRFKNRKFTFRYYENLINPEIKDGENQQIKET